ncbi:MAG: gamma-glutamylcyclotransferase family protein [Pyrinomonadaceae bacterium]
MNENLFSYGTLQKSKVQMELFGRLLNGTKDILNGWKISSIEIKDEIFLARGEGKFQKTLIQSSNFADFVEGIVFEISEEELLVADKYEPDNYKRIKVTLQSGKEAWIYTVV